jgi:fructosamine-3-kinase
MPDWAAVSAAIGVARGAPFVPQRHAEVGGGCINRAYVLAGCDGSRWFVKLNHADKLAMFQAEARGLEEIQAARSLRCPAPLCVGASGAESWLVLEYMALAGHGSETELGLGLAALHGHVTRHYGWDRDNTIGATAQSNRQSSDWLEFWREQRLRYQLDLAAVNRLVGRVLDKGERLAASLEGLFPGYRPAASLLHGDLWGGNVAYAEGSPVIFDPAVYYGDRETDLAMTELFGGFGTAFYAAYREAAPLDPGYPVRKLLYNLYHVLNHFNLFGGNYAGQAERMIDQLLAHLG